MGVFKSTLATAGATEKEIALTRIKVLYATNSSDSQIDLWVKNIGTNQIVALDKVDVYFGELNYVQLIPYNATSAPSWEYSELNIIWPAKETVEINVSYDSTLERNVNYVVRISTPNGVSDDYIFSIS
jgi:hypothetical protein